MVLEKTLESPLGCKEIQQVHSEGDQPWVFFGRNDVKAETDSLEKTLMMGKIEGRRRRGQQRMRWLDGHEFEQALGVGEGQGSLACCSPRGRKESGTTDQLSLSLLLYIQFSSVQSLSLVQLFATA